MKKVYLVCPKCGICNDGWGMVVREYEYQTWGVYDNLVDIFDSEYHDTEVLLTKHICGFEADNYHVEDFSIQVDGNEVVAIGCYWRDHLEDLKKLVNFKISENVEVL